MNNLIRLLLISILMMVSFDVLAFQFPLPEENFVKSKMPMYLIFPRPDSETQTLARHRWAHPDMPYEIPIGVQGGAWPFKYEIISAPAGATIGEYYGDKNYGVVSWKPLKNTGVETFIVRVTDQQQDTIDLTWNVTIDPDNFVFIQDGWTGTKSGTIDQPLEDWSDWYKNDNEDNTYHNKIIVFRSGNYSVIGDNSTVQDGNAGNVVLYNTSKTHQLIGWPGEHPVLDCSNAKIISGFGNTQDMFVADIVWQNARKNVNNEHIFRAWSDMTRSTWWRNNFKNVGTGIKGTDNPNAIFISGTGTHKHNILIKGNTFEQINTGRVNGSYIDLYNSSHVLIEENSAKNSSAGYGFWMKVTNQFVTVRANEAYDNVTGQQIVIGYADGIQPNASDHEVCWNRIRLPSGSSENSILWAMDRGFEGKSYNSYIYRNTFVNGKPTIRYKGVEPYETDRNVVVSDYLSVWDTSIILNRLPDILGSSSKNITDESGLLIGSYRAKYLGTTGHEISDVYATSPEATDDLKVE